MQTIRVWLCIFEDKEVWLIYYIALNPDPMNLPPLDQKDAFLLADASASTGAYSINGSSQPGSSAIQPTLANVSWLRKTEYITRESSQKQGGQEPYVSPLTVHFFVPNVLEILSGSTSSLHQLMYLGTHNFATLKPRSQLRMNDFHLENYDTLINPTWWP